MSLILDTSACARAIKTKHAQLSQGCFVMQPHMRLPRVRGLTVYMMLTISCYTKKYPRDKSKYFFKS